MEKAEEYTIPQFLSTHPSVINLLWTLSSKQRALTSSQSKNRITTIQKWQVLAFVTSKAINLSPILSDLTHHLNRLPQAQEKRAQSECGNTIQFGTVNPFVLYLPILALGFSTIIFLIHLLLVSFTLSLICPPSPPYPPPFSKQLTHSHPADAFLTTITQIPTETFW